jgi:cytochrome c biogenesis protein CcdA
MKICQVLAFILLTLQSIFADEQIPAKPVEIGVSLSTINKHHYLAITYKNAEGWHTYWKNPGDAGLPIENKFKFKNKDLNLNELEWPRPHRFIENGNQWAYGQINEYTLFYSIDEKILKNIKKESPLSLQSKWLVCKNICIPGTISIEIWQDGNITNTNLTGLLPRLSNEEFEARFNQLPILKKWPEYLDVKLFKGNADKSLLLEVKLNNSYEKSYIKNTNLIFPYPKVPFGFKHEDLDLNPQFIVGQFDVDWDGEYQTPPVDLPKDGKFKKPMTLKLLLNDPVLKESYIVEKTFTHFLLNPPVKIVSNANNNNENKDTIAIVEKKNETTSDIWHFLLFAFIGGLILNVMPCVLPVISLKLFGLIKYSQESNTRIFKHNLFYTLGILVTFLILAGTIVLLKSFGLVVGWGFQLQSPTFIAVTAIVLFIFSLNLFGMFEFSTPGGKHLGNVNLKDNFVGDFLSGVLATILSTPCSAPFLGTALTFAFTTSTQNIFIIFLAIGLGLASPFILTAFFPNLVHFLPRPGNWMNTLKKILGLTIVLTIFWLLDVFNTLVGGQTHLIKLLTVMLLIFSGIYISKKEKWFSYIAYLFAIALFVYMQTTPIITNKDLESSTLMMVSGTNGKL